MLSAVRISRARTPRLSYFTAMKKVLGGEYVLELIFATPSIMKKIYGKNTNVLSFRLTKNQGQLFLEPNFIRREAPLYNRSFRAHLWALYIHGLLHLKGYVHGQKMELVEKKLCRGI